MLTLTLANLAVVRSIVLARVNPPQDGPWLAPGANGEALRVPVSYSDVRRTDAIVAQIDEVSAWAEKAGESAVDGKIFKSSDLDYIRTAMMLINWWQVPDTANACELMDAFDVPKGEVVWVRDGHQLAYKAV